MLIFWTISIAQICAAAELAVGLGGSYTQVGWNSRTGSSNYSGGGGLADLRLGVPFKGKRGSVEFFGSYSDQFLENTNHSLGEINRRIGIGGGLDFFYGMFFLGGQYEYVSSRINSVNLSADLNYDAYGPRAGIHIRLKGRSSLMIGAVAEIGDLNVPVNLVNQNRDVSEYRAFLLYRFRLFGGRRSSSKSYSARN